MCGARTVHGHGRATAASLRLLGEVGARPGARAPGCPPGCVVRDAPSLIQHLLHGRGCQRKLRRAFRDAPY
eukprot:10725542-Lingulodinium_polyedra.AAC.1